MNEIQETPFDQWFEVRFLIDRNINSPIIVSENKTQLTKFRRFKTVTQEILDKPDKSIVELRREIVLKFFVTMKTALDYINYANLIIEEYNDYKSIEKRAKKQ